uniref:Uncharacterized protein n=1 Tax=Parascaris equorum TaxID=6256 RepID=A0A914RVA8_PAREQ
MWNKIILKRMRTARHPLKNEKRHSMQRLFAKANNIQRYTHIDQPLLREIHQISINVEYATTRCYVYYLRSYCFI